MRFALGAFRLAIAFAAIAVFTILIFATAWIPIRIKGVRIAAWPTTLAARLAMVIFNVRFRCPAPGKIWRHQGLVFTNHITYFDILVLLRVLPLRFVCKREIGSWPFIGWAARAAGAVLVDRGDKALREDTRRQIARAERYPPIVLFPEGGAGPPKSLRPFRYDAFEVAQEHGIPYLLCAIIYDRADVIAWKEETQNIASLLRAFWRLACTPGPFRVLLEPLSTVTPRPGDKVELLAVAAHRAIADALGVRPQMGA